MYRQSTRWWPGNGPINWRRLTGIAELGDFQALQRFNEEAGGESKPSPVLSAINGRPLPAVRSACSAAQQFEAVMCMLALARLGDLDSAYDFADRLYPSRLGRTPAEEDRIWLDNPGCLPLAFITSPAAAPLRRDPRYLPLAQRVGLLEYWRSGRLPDFCTVNHEPICKAIARTA
jgi:hypothetical protein